MSEGLVFITAISRRAAADLARELHLPPSAWRYLDDTQILRGRRAVRIAYGYRYFDHPRAQEIESVLAVIEKRIPGSVERVEVPA